MVLSPFIHSPPFSPYRWRLYGNPDGFRWPMVLVPDIIDLVSNDLKLRIIFSVRGFCSLLSFPLCPISFRHCCPYLTIFIIRFLPDIIDFITVHLQLRRIFVKGGVCPLSFPPVSSLNVHLSRTDLIPRLSEICPICFVPGVVNFSSVQLYLR